MNSILEVVPAESTMQGSLLDSPLDSPLDRVSRPSQRQVARNAMHNEICAE
jgi:hypothetical protein